MALALITLSPKAYSLSPRVRLSSYENSAGSISACWLAQFSAETSQVVSEPTEEKSNRTRGNVRTRLWRQSCRSLRTRFESHRSRMLLHAGRSLTELINLPTPWVQQVLAGITSWALGYNGLALFGLSFSPNAGCLLVTGKVWTRAFLIASLRPPVLYWRGMALLRSGEN